MNIYLGFIPFVSIDAIMQTGGSVAPFFDFNNKSKYTQVEIDNFRILDNGRVSFIIDLDTSSISNLDFDKYNAVIIPSYSNKYRIYSISNIAYTSATNYLVTAVPTYLDAIYNSGDYIDPTKLKSKTSFIRYGYAYDSILDSHAKINLNSNGSTDIYTRDPNYITPNLPLWHKKLEMDNCEYNSSLTDAKKNLINTTINKYVLGWVIIYLNKTAKPRITDDEDDPSNGHAIFDARYHTDDADNIQMPFSVAVAPLLNQKALATDNINLSFRTIFTKDDRTYDYPYITADKVFWYLGAYIVDASAEILYVKVCKTLPFRPEIFNNITVSETNINIYLTASQTPFIDSPCGNEDYFIEGIGAGLDMLFVPQFLDCRTKTTLPISMTTLVANGYPTGYKTTDTISKSDFKSVNNPYITANTYMLKVRDMVGGEYSYTPLQLGHFDNLRFKVVESLTPDPTKTYVWVDPTITSDGLIAGHYAKENFMGLINSTDFSYPYSQNQLDIFLANNKNFFQQQEIERMVSTVNGIMGAFGVNTNQSYSSGFNQSQGVSHSVGTRVTKNNWAMAQNFSLANQAGASDTIRASGSIAGKANIVGGIGSTIMSGVASYMDMNFQIDNLRNAPTAVSNVNGNIFFNLQYGEFGFYIDLYTVNELTKKVMYQDFIRKGLYLNRFIESSEVSKYVSITINEYDKRYYKYVEGDFEFYIDYAVAGDYVNMKHISAINSIYSGGVTIYQIGNLKFDNPDNTLDSYNTTYELEILNLVDEEEVN